MSFGLSTMKVEKLWKIVERKIAGFNVIVNGNDNIAIATTYNGQMIHASENHEDVFNKAIEWIGTKYGLIAVFDPGFDYTVTNPIEIPLNITLVGIGENVAITSDGKSSIYPRGRVLNIIYKLNNDWFYKPLDIPYGVRIPVFIDHWHDENVETTNTDYTQAGRNIQFGGYISIPEGFVPVLHAFITIEPLGSATGYIRLLNIITNDVLCEYSSSDKVEIIYEEYMDSPKLARSYHSERLLISKQIKTSDSAVTVRTYRGDNLMIMLERL